MATNPNNAIGTNAAYGGRTSPKAFNDVLSAFDGRGILSGWKVAPNSGMTIALGGDGDNRDVAIAEDNAGNMTTVNNISGSPVSFTIAAAPASQSRIDAIVVYVNNPPQGASSVTDNYGTVGILDVQGTVAGTPAKPNDSDIRTAITADGASGATAYYVVLGYVTIPNGTTTITSNLIEQGSVVVTNIVSTDIIDGIVTADKIASGAVTTDKIASSSVTTGKIANGAVTAAKITPDNINYGVTTSDIRIGTFNGDPLYRKVETFTNLPRGFSQHKFTNNIVNLKEIIRIDGSFNSSGAWISINSLPPDNLTKYGISVRDITYLNWAAVLGTSMSTTNNGYVIIDYTTTS